MTESLGQFLESFDRYLENRTPREKLQDAFIDRIVDGMSHEDLVAYAYDSLNDYYSDLSDEDLAAQVNELLPDLFQQEEQ